MINIDMDKGHVGKFHMEGDVFELVADVCTIAHLIYSEISKKNIFSGKVFETMLKSNVDSIFDSEDDLKAEAKQILKDNFGMPEAEVDEFMDRDANEIEMDIEKMIGKLYGVEENESEHQQD